MDEKFDEIMARFEARVASEPARIEDPTTLTVWVPRTLKERYKCVQHLTDRRFAETLRELIEAATERAEKALKAS